MTFLGIKLKRMTYAALAVLMSLFVYSAVNIAEAGNYQTQEAGSGRVICGAADLGTRQLTAACGFDKATKVGPAKGTCPSGSFFDVGTWSCFTCPSGFNRTGFAVDTDKACSQEISPPRYTAAIQTGSQEQCTGGSFLDGRNGGECWKCPSGYGRTGSAVDQWDACGMIFKQARSAEFIKSVCPEGSFPDPNGKCYRCPEDAVRTWEAATHPRACMQNENQEPANKEAALTCNAGEHFDFIDGGTCWTCPAGSVRSTLSVKGSQACEYLTMRWESKPRTPNGLFAIPGGPEIAAEVIAEKETINRNLERFRKSQNITDPDYFAKAWNLIETSPQESPALIAAVYEHVFNLIKKGTKKPYEAAFLDYFATYVQQSRQLTANEMHKALESWKLGLTIRTGLAASPTNMANAYNIGFRPPDMRLISEDIMTTVGAGALVGAAYWGLTTLEASSPAFANVSSQLAKGLLPFRFREAATEGVQLIKIGLHRAATTAGTTAGASGGAALSSIAAPFVVATAAAIVFSVATDIVMDMDKQDAIVNDALAVAQRPVILSRLALNDAGRGELMANWFLMTQETIAPNPSQWAALQQQYSMNNKPISGTRWQDFGQRAIDVAVGSDQSVYILKERVLPNGFQVARLDPYTNTFKDIGVVAAIHIAVGENVLWGINKNNQVFYLDGNTVRIFKSPPASQIAAANQHVWILDMNGVPYRLDAGSWVKVSGQGKFIAVDRAGRPWIANAKREIWTQDANRKWVKYPGEALEIAAFEEGRGTVVGTDGRAYFYSPESKRWEMIGSNTDHRKLAMNYSQLWRINRNGQLGKWQ